LLVLNLFSAVNTQVYEGQGLEPFFVNGVAAVFAYPLGIFLDAEQRPVYLLHDGPGVLASWLPGFLVQGIYYLVIFPLRHLLGKVLFDSLLVVMDILVERIDATCHFITQCMQPSFVLGISSHQSLPIVPRTDILIKGNRDIQYGHKLNLSAGKSGLILDVVIEEGNPADTERLLPMPERHINQYRCAPKQVAVDGGYASKDNLDKAKESGIKDVAFHKKRGLRIEEMVKSTWVYRQLRNFRAGIEACISCLKRAYGV